MASAQSRDSTGHFSLLQVTSLFEHAHTMQGLSVINGIWRTSPSFSHFATDPVRKEEARDMGTPEQLSSSRTQQVIPGEHRQGRSARALTPPENQSIVTWRESRAAAGPASPPLARVAAARSQSKGLVGRRAGRQSAEGGGRPERRGRSGGAPGGGVLRPASANAAAFFFFFFAFAFFFFFFSKGVARSGLASAPEQGWEEGWRLPSALAAPRHAQLRPARLLRAGRGGRTGRSGEAAGSHEGTTLPATELSRLRSDRRAPRTPCQAV